MDISIARKLITIKLAAVIQCIIIGDDEMKTQYAYSLIEMIGFVRGRTANQRSVECNLLFRMGEALRKSELDSLMDIQRQWSDQWKKARESRSHYSGHDKGRDQSHNSGHDILTGQLTGQVTGQVKRVSGVQSGGTG